MCCLLFRRLQARFVTGLYCYFVLISQVSLMHARSSVMRCQVQAHQKPVTVLRASTGQSVTRCRLLSAAADFIICIWEVKRLGFGDEITLKLMSKV